MDFILDIQANEDDFISACVRKEKWAQKKLYEDHYPVMLPVCKRYSNNSDDALDILHEGFIKVFRHISKYNSGTSLSAWIRRIMINTAIDYYRKKSRKRTEDLESAFGVMSKDSDIISEMSAAEILESLQKLTFAYKAVFNLYVIEGYSHREVAEQLGITESTSRSNLVKARTKLKAILLSKQNNGK